MHAHPAPALRAAFLATALFSLGSSLAAASPRPLWGYFFCHHEDQLGNFVDIPNDVPDAGLVPTTLDLMIAGAGAVSGLQAPVVCYTNEYTIDLTNGLGHAVFKLRDRSGDVLVIEADVVMGPMDMTKIFSHPAATYESTFTVDGAKSTGRFAGATGRGYIAGWADNDPPVPFTTGQSYWSMCGWITLAAQPGHGADACGDRP